MASQIAHIVYAKKYFDRLESGELFESLSPEEMDGYPLGKLDKDEFLLGTTFPDIRRIDPNIKRKDTHLRFKKINLDFSGLSSFEAGWKFHLYCDMKREEVLNKHDFYSLPGAADIFHYPAKILEDEVLYDAYNNWEKIKNYFNNPPKIELDIEISRETINLWFAILAKYFEEKPTERTIRAFLLKQLRLPAKIEEIVGSVKKIGENNFAAEILRKVPEEII